MKYVISWFMFSITNILFFMIGFWCRNRIALYQLTIKRERERERETKPLSYRPYYNYDRRYKDYE